MAFSTQEPNSILILCKVPTVAFSSVDSNFRGFATTTFSQQLDELYDESLTACWLVCG